MDWRRFKTIIIVVLIIINIFFGAYLIKMELSESKVEEKTRNNVISILGKNNIKINENQFPQNRETCSSCYVSRVLPTDKKVINKILGKNGKLSVEDEIMTFSLEAKDGVNLNEEEILSRCRSFMTENGILADIYENDSVKINGKNAEVRFCLTYDGSRFFDSFIEFYLSEKGIYKIVGRNIIKAEGNLSSHEAELFPVESILVTVAKDKKSDKQVEIKDITFGYYLGKSADVYVSVLALPVWKIEFDDGFSLFYDARNGNLINVNV